MKPIFGKTREEAWLKAVKHLLQEAEGLLEYNLILEIEKPLASDAHSRDIRGAIDSLLQNDAGLYPVHTVAETIFPLVEYKKNGIEGVYTTYPEEVYPLIKSNPGNSKGTYAKRLVRGIDAQGRECNPLKNVVGRLKSQLASSGGIRCAFELPIDKVEGAEREEGDSSVESIPINRNDSFTRGFPCLSHLSFKLSHKRDALHLTALYRSHDYIQKALGNLLGIARLQACVAKELGIDVGVLVCHSTLARLDVHPGLGKGKIQAMIDAIEGEYSGGE